MADHKAPFSLNSGGDGIVSLVLPFAGLAHDERPAAPKVAQKGLHHA